MRARVRKTANLRATVNVKPVILREQAKRDLDDAVSWHLLKNAFAHISHHPATGFPRYIHALRLTGLRVWAPVRFLQVVAFAIAC
jgi:toxin ParE1/3/4